MRLRDRNRQVPGGLKFFIPQIKSWQPQPWSSLTSIAEQVLAVRQANPALTAQHGWSLDLAKIESEVDEFNANMCAALGHTNFITGGEGAATFPKPNPPSQAELSRLSAAGEKAREIWSGIKTLNRWLDSGEPGVEPALAESRAATCVACPLNTTGGFESWFTKPAAAAIQKQLERLHEMKLSTSVDDKLNVCSACLCPLRLKSWTPLKFIKAELRDETIDKLRQGKDCWILKELAQ